MFFTENTAMVEIRTTEELGIHNEVHLCLSCCYEVPVCNPDNLIMGNDIGEDNIVACNIYDPIALRNPRE